MAITKKQKELDELKWLKSEELGQDACGTFDYCAACDKTLENPCDKAYRKTHTKPKVKKAAEPTGKKPATHRSSAKKDAAVKAPAAPAVAQAEPKKPAAKKTATKKAAGKETDKK